MKGPFFKTRTCASPLQRQVLYKLTLLAVSAGVPVRATVSTTITTTSTTASTPSAGPSASSTASPARPNAAPSATPLLLLTNYPDPGPGGAPGGGAEGGAGASSGDPGRPNSPASVSSLTSAQTPSTPVTTRSAGAQAGRTNASAAMIIASFLPPILPAPQPVQAQEPVTAARLESALTAAAASTVASPNAKSPSSSAPGWNGFGIPPLSQDGQRAAAALAELVSPYLLPALAAFQKGGADARDTAEAKSGRLDTIKSFEALLRVMITAGAINFDEAALRSVWYALT